MLKIYLKTVKYEVHSGGSEYAVSHSCFHTIVDDAEAQSYTREYGLYDDEIMNITYHCEYYDDKRGRVTRVYGSDCYLKFKSWKEPDAKLIERVSYKEYACSMNELCRLPADKVIAYLKQEGLSFSLTN